MKKFLALMLAISMLMLVGCNSSKNSSSIEEDSTATEVTTEAAQEDLAEKVSDVNSPMIVNGTFDSSSVDPWMIFKQDGMGNISINDGKLVADIQDTGTVNYGVQLYQDGFKINQGCKYQLKFDVSSTIPRSMECRIQINGGDYHAYISKIVDITTEMKTVTVDFEMTEPSDPAPRLVFNLGLPDGVSSIAPHQVFFDNISLALTDSSTEVKTNNDDVKAPNINIDQIGYKTDEKKIAIFRGDNIDKTFDVIDVNNGKTVYTGEIKNQISNSTAGEINAYGEFSDLKIDGTYYIKTKNLGKSYEFKIGKDIYKSAYNDTLKMLYLQRCGSEIKSDVAGDFAHPACHTGKALIYGTNTKIDVSGGWHDAGDYGRYVVPGAKTVADLLIAYEQNPSSFSDNSGIPEKGNSVPDILDEARYELEWMLKMQDKTSGGVYHKVTCASFPGSVMPQDEKEQLIVSPISVTASADFAAVMAMSSRVYDKYDKTFAKKCLQAAKKAWGYVAKTENGEGFKNPKDISTGAYDDANDQDERYWAAAELFRVTGEKQYNDVVIACAPSYVPGGFGWQYMGYYGSLAYINTDKSLVDMPTYDRIKNSLLDKAKEIYNSSKTDGYFISLGEKYPWGSNMSVANNAMLLLIADNIQPNKDYVQSAREHLHYLLGRNPMSISYLTGYGTVSPLNAHHRPSMVLKKAMPGMLVGGPDSNLEDPYAKNVLKDAAPAKCYADNAQSFSTNEITIYWNSPLVYMFSELD